MTSQARGATEEHLSAYLGRGMKCDQCAGVASAFARCARCRKVHATCSGHDVARARATCCPDVASAGGVPVDARAAVTTDDDVPPWER